MAFSEKDVQEIHERYLNRQEEKKEVKLEQRFDDFKPTLAGCVPMGDAVLLRELKFPDDDLVIQPDAFAEPMLFGEVIASAEWVIANGPIYFCKGDIVRFLKGIGTTIQFADGEEGQRYLTISRHDVICKWAKQ